MSEREALFFREVLIPLAYLEERVKKQPTKKRKKIYDLIEEFRKRAREGPWPKDNLEKKKIEAKEIATMFQRSSSCVEGRNGALSLKHHGFHRVSKKTLRALTVVHNYHVKRSDGSTAAERFFGRAPDGLFDYMLEKVPMLGRPRVKRVKLNDQKLAA